eukprot:4649344-Pleurochrysis_carterae.AAC.1
MSSDELPEPGLDGAGSSAYHSLVPPDVHEADGNELATFSHDSWRYPASRSIIIRPQWIASSSSSPDEISGPLPSTPFGTEPRVLPRL